MSISNPTLLGVIQTPSTLEITSISQSKPMVVTVSADPLTAENTYQAKQLVKFIIPFLYGMQQLSEKILEIESVSGNELTFNINSTFFDPFAEPASGQKPASLAPYGSRNLEFSNTTSQLAFQSLNNRGN